MICTEGLQSPARMMIDTGAGRNLIKQNSVNPNLPTDGKIVLKLTQTLTIPARTVTTFYVPIENTEKSEGYVPRLHFGEGIYAGVAIVKNCNGKAYIKCANTNEISVTISIPAITLEEFEERDFQNVTSQSSNLKNLSNDDLSNKILNIFLKTDNFFDNPCKFFNITGEERIECIKKLLRLDHLNQDEYEHVERLIINSADRFQIPGKPLEATNVLQH